MKIYRKVVIDMATGKTVLEDAFEYSGVISECKGGGGGSSTTTYTQSPEQAAVYAALLPTIQRLGLAGQQGGDASLYNVPQYPTAPTAPSMQGVLSGTPQYQIPNIQQMMPSQQWYNDLSPEVMAGIRAPYEDASKQLTESLGYSAGSPMAGASGVLGGSQAKFWADAGTQMGQQAWNMTAPAMQAGWGAQLGQNQLGYQNIQQERTADYQNILAQQQAGYAGQQNMWQQQLQQNMLPYSIIPGLTGGTYSNPVVNQGSGGFSGTGALMGAGLGGYGGYLAGAKIGALGGPWGMALGAGVGGLLGSGMFG